MDWGQVSAKGGSHRRYSVVDLARLDYMAALIRSGSSPAQAAATALAREFTPQECAHNRYSDLGDGD